MPGCNLKIICALLLAAFLVSACAGKQGDAAMGEDLKAAFVDKEWVAEYILGAPVIDMSHSSIKFQDDGTATGSGGCNSYSGSYTLEGDVVSFGPMATTMMMCGGAIDDQEMRFFQSLAAPLTVKIENGMLYLSPAEGKSSIFGVQN